MTNLPQQKHGTNNTKKPNENSSTSESPTRSINEDALAIYGKGIAEYEKLKRKLNAYFIPNKNKHYARYLFLKVKSTHGETATVHAARLREKANECEFGTACEE